MIPRALRHRGQRLRWLVLGQSLSGRRWIEDRLGQPLSALRFARDQRHVALRSPEGFVLAYRMDSGLDSAVRYMCAIDLLTRNRIHVPRLLWKRFVRTENGVLFVACVSEVFGDRFQPSGPGQAQAFAAELHRWHALDVQGYPLDVSGPWGRAAEWDDTELGRRVAAWGLSQLTEPIRDVVHVLGKGTALGAMRMSHGDFNRSNVVQRNEGGIGWCDLDTVMPRPLGLDLAEAQMTLMHEHLPAVDYFEEAYFAKDADGLAVWRSARLHWFRLLYLRKTVLRPLSPTQLAARRPAERSRRFHAGCLAALRLHDVGQASSEMVAEVRARIREAARAAASG